MKKKFRTERIRVSVNDTGQSKYPYSPLLQQEWILIQKFIQDVSIDLHVKLKSTKLLRGNQNFCYLELGKDEQKRKLVKWSSSKLSSLQQILLKRMIPQPQTGRNSVNHISDKEFLFQICE